MADNTKRLSNKSVSKDYNIENFSSEIKNIDKVYYEEMCNGAKAAALVGPLGGMIGGPMGGINSLAAINSLAGYAGKLLKEDEKYNKN